MCVLVADSPVPACLRGVTASGAFLETNARPELGAAVDLHHPEAGLIAAIVRAHRLDGIEVAFPAAGPAIAFALAALAADTTGMVQQPPA